MFNDPAYLARFPAALAVIAADDNIDSLLVILGPMSRGTEEILGAVAALGELTRKPVCVAWPFCPDHARVRLGARGLGVFEEPDRAVRAVASTLCLADRPPDPVPVRPAPVSWHRWVPAAGPGRVLSEPECHRLLAAAGLPVAAGELITSETGLTDVISRLGPPVVLKGVSGQVTHRDAAGLVRLDVRTPEEARAAYRALRARAAELGQPLDGIYVQRLVRGELEILVSAFRDAGLGVVVSCGAGGTLTELVDDVTFARAPVSRDGAARMLGRLRVVQHAVRHGRQAGLAEAAQFVAAVSQLAADAPWRQFTLEINPVMVGAAGAVAVDGLVVVEQP